MKELRLIVLGLVGVMVAGCGEPYDPNLGQKVSPTEMNAAKDRRSEAIAIYNRAGGVWDKMTPDDKKRMLELSAGDERMAQRGWPMLGQMK